MPNQVRAYRRWSLRGGYVPRRATTRERICSPPPHSLLHGAQLLLGWGWWVCRRCAFLSLVLGILHSLAWPQLTTNLNDVEYRGWLLPFAFHLFCRGVHQQSMTFCLQIIYGCYCIWSEFPGSDYIAPSTFMPRNQQPVWHTTNSYLGIYTVYTFRSYEFLWWSFMRFYVNQSLQTWFNGIE